MASTVQTAIVGSQAAVRHARFSGVSVRAPRSRANSRANSRLNASYKVTFKIPGEDDITIDCPEDTYMLDAFEEAETGFELPSSCRAGSCSSCLGLLEGGTVDQDEQSFLDEEQMGQGYILTCVAYPQSDCVVATDKESDLY
ncbi:hypothetical protein BSKO_03353 [Bryopsis sp. KO-2023]|nr:hypothetical protein BSKO_03353 [Bryopsis sp. KO-2023]